VSWETKEDVDHLRKVSKDRSVLSRCSQFYRLLAFDQQIQLGGVVIVHPSMIVPLPPKPALRPSSSSWFPASPLNTFISILCIGSGELRFFPSGSCFASIRPTG